jgi:short-subunit dehydrogenase
LIKKKHGVSHGQVAVISGASDLQTKAIAKQLSKQGVTVILNDRVETSDSNTRRRTETNGPKSSGSIVEITSFADANDLTTYVARKYGRIDFLIIRDALEKNVSLQLGDLSRFRELVQANVLESIDLVKESLRYLHESRGSLLFISSLAGLRCLPGLCPSAMIQMAKRSLAESLGTELASVGIHSGIMYVRDEIKDCSDTGAEWGYNEKFDKDLNAPQAVAEEMALKVLYALLKRKPISIVGSEVRLYYNLRRFLPWLMDYVLPTPIECRNSGQKYSFNLNEKS